MRLDKILPEIDYEKEAASAKRRSIIFVLFSILVPIAVLKGFLMPDSENLGLDFRTEKLPMTVLLKEMQ